MNKMYDVIVIGAGVAGLTSAIYLRRANKNVLVLESTSYGGQIINANNIENYPGYLHISGFDLATNLYNQARELGTEIKFEKVLEVSIGKNKKVITNKNQFRTKSIIIATGCENRKLDLPGEDELVGKGVSYCATCDGNFYKGKEVAVVGGGNTAIEDALYLANICKKVYLIHRRDSFRAFEREVELLKSKENVIFILNSNITKINGKDKLESIEVTSKEEKKLINIDGLFIAIGKEPFTEIFKNDIKLNSDGYIKSHNGLTNRKGVFAAGDVCEKQLRQLVTATSDGAIAAMEAIKYLNK